MRELTPNAVIKRMRFGDYGVSCVVDSFGEDGPEVSECRDQADEIR